MRAPFVALQMSKRYLISRHSLSVYQWVQLGNSYFPASEKSWSSLLDSSYGYIKYSVYNVLKFDSHPERNTSDATNHMVWNQVSFWCRQQQIELTLEPVKV